LLKMSDHELDRYRRTKVGFVWQQVARNLVPYLSAQANVELPMTVANLSGQQKRARSQELLRAVGLWDHRDHKLVQLSGGQQQRVAIARAIVTAPKMILADEPTGNLDSKTTVEIMALLQALGRSGITIVFVTHEPDVAAYASRVIVVRDGRIQSDTTQTPVVATPEAAAPEPAKKNEEARA